MIMFFVVWNRLAISEEDGAQSVLNAPAGLASAAFAVTYPTVIMAMAVITSKVLGGTVAHIRTTEQIRSPLAE